MILNLLYSFSQILVKRKPKGRRITPADANAGDYVNVEWHRFHEPVGSLTVISNDPQTKKIFLRAKFRDSKAPTGVSYERHIFKYNEYAFRNFHLLNQHLKENIKGESVYDETNLIELQSAMNKALDEEDYETAETLQRKINRLSKQQK